jgi:signal transduction histidine kinase
VFVRGDADMIRQATANLISNAVRYTPEGGTITLKTEERVSADEKGRVKREVCIEVADTGIGITAEELPRIFDRFYRGENARSDNTGGSGLGLSIARWIAEQHRGRIEAISSPGIGTKMTVIIPCSDAAG